MHVFFFLYLPTRILTPNLDFFFQIRLLARNIWNSSIFWVLSPIAKKTTLFYRQSRSKFAKLATHRQVCCRLRFVETKICGDEEIRRRRNAIQSFAETKICVRRIANEEMWYKEMRDKILFGHEHNNSADLPSAFDSRRLTQVWLGATVAHRFNRVGT